AAISTFVVGLPVTDAEANVLNEFAKAGGVPNPTGSNGELYYPISSTNTLTDLTAVFSTLITQLVRTCDIPLNSAGPFDANSIRVAVDCESIPAVPSSETSQLDAGQASGWMLDTSQNP